VLKQIDEMIAKNKPADLRSFAVFLADDRKATEPRPRENWKPLRRKRRRRKLTRSRLKPKRRRMPSSGRRQQKNRAHPEPGCGN
jgi:hypothetical protein